MGPLRESKGERERLRKRDGSTWRTKGGREGGKEVYGVHFLNYSAPEWGERWGPGGTDWVVSLIGELCTCLCVFPMTACTSESERSYIWGRGYSCPFRPVILLFSSLVLIMFSFPQNTCTRTFSKVLLFMGCWMGCRSKWLLSSSSS